jgi:hypothetical protein
MDFDELMKRWAVSLPCEWISRRKSSPEVVKRARIHGVKTEASQKDRVIELIRRMQPGDELRKFESPRETWKLRRGRRGYVVLRNGKPLFAIVTMLN